LSQAEGGRKSPPPGPVYATTGRIANLDVDFSIILRDPARISVGNAMEKDLELSLLCPDRLPNVIERIQPGTAVSVFEGRRLVAAADIIQVRMEEWPPKQPIFDNPVPEPVQRG
jgi:hypothetical protein